MAEATPAGNRQFLRFVAVGGFAAAVNVLARWLLDPFMPYSAAIVLAYLVGMVTAFTLSKLYVFEQSGRPAHSEFIRFTLVNLAAVVQVWAVSIGLAEYLFPWLGLDAHRHDIAHVIGVAVPVVTSYLGHKYFSFAAEPDVSAPPRG